MRDTTPRIKTWEELKALIASEGQVYVRWSRSPRLDARRGYSYNHAGMSREPGLSVQTIAKDDMDHFDGDLRISLLLLDYRFCGPVCSLWTGEVVGHGGDNEDVITPTACLGIVSKDVIEMALQYRTKGGY